MRSFLMISVLTIASIPAFAASSPSLQCTASLLTNPDNSHAGFFWMAPAQAPVVFNYQLGQNKTVLLSLKKIGNPIQGVPGGVAQYELVTSSDQSQAWVSLHFSNSQDGETLPAPQFAFQASEIAHPQNASQFMGGLHASIATNLNLTVEGDATAELVVTCVAR